jgi:hypothetical protein
VIRWRAVERTFPGGVHAVELPTLELYEREAKHGVCTFWAIFSLPIMPPASKLVSVFSPARSVERVMPFTPFFCTAAWIAC